MRSIGKVVAGLLLAILIMASLWGCNGTQQVKVAAAEVEQAAITANDLQLKLSEKGLCSSSLSAIKRAYGDDPQMLRYVLGLCRWSNHNIDVITGTSIQ